MGANPCGLDAFGLLPNFLKEILGFPALRSCHCLRHALAVERDVDGANRFAGHVQKRRCLCCLFPTDRSGGPSHHLDGVITFDESYDTPSEHLEPRILGTTRAAVRGKVEVFLLHQPLLENAFLHQFLLVRGWPVLWRAQTSEPEARILPPESLELWRLRMVVCPPLAFPQHVLKRGFLPASRAHGALAVPDCALPHSHQGSIV